MITSITDCFCVFLRCKIEYQLVLDLTVNISAPEIIQIFTEICFKTRLHFKSVWCYAVKGLQHSVKTRKNPQMLFYIRRCFSI